MGEQDYEYQLKPLVIPGTAFLVIYPATVLMLYFLTKLPALEFRLLLIIYAVAAAGLISLWVFAKSKRVRIEDESITFSSILGKKSLHPDDIRRVSFFHTKQGQEVAQIRTHRDSYYLTEFYFPFPELMSDLEYFVQAHGIKSNLS
ncbi:MAG: PH domain-containing protein [Desulfitobacteriaceae bacterium]